MSSVLLSFYLVMVIVIEACLDHGTSPTLKEGWNQGSERAQISVLGFCNSLSIIIFAFMYQVNIPALYNELEGKDMSKIKLVIIIGTIMACVLYVVAASFGYMSFAAGTTDDQLETIFGDNILKAPYHKAGTTDVTPIVIYISLFGMCLVVSIACPFCVLPTKDGIEEIQNKKFTAK